MFRWYGRSRICIAYLADLKLSSTSRHQFVEAFQRSAWFTRGWTLQELLAPPDVLFCDGCWQPVGSKELVSSHSYHSQRPERISLAQLTWHGDLTDVISERTKISVSFLRSCKSMEAASIACKMSWAAHRVTTRVEDAAYCLLGIFSINIPLLYGEGDRAFLRVQEEIVRRSNDQSIFAWRLPRNKALRTMDIGAFAKAPSYFADCGRIEVFGGSQMNPFHSTNIGVEMKARLQPAQRENPILMDGSLIYVLRLDRCWETVSGPPDHETTRPCEIAVIYLPGTQILRRIHTHEPSLKSIYPLAERGPHEEEDRMLYLAIGPDTMSMFDDDVIL